MSTHSPLGAAATAGQVSEERLEEFEEKSKWVMLGLTVAIIPSLAVPYLVQLSPAWRHALSALDIFLWAAFAAEYLWRLRLARARWRFVKNNKIDGLLVLIPLCVFHAPWTPIPVQADH